MPCLSVLHIADLNLNFFAFLLLLFLYPITTVVIGIGFVFLLKDDLVFLLENCRAQPSKILS